jgi:DNA-binding IclR family transcriptional regulator
VDASRTVRDSVHEGDRLPLAQGAAGHVLRAFRGARGERYDRVRDSMFDASFGERDPEIAAFACPVFGHGNQLVGAVSLSGPRYRIEALGEAKIVPVLFKHAQTLTRTFGGDPDAAEFAGWNKKAARKAAKPAARPGASGSAAKSRASAG